MKSIRTSKEILKEWIEANMKTHTDRTGTRIETEKIWRSIDEMVEYLYVYLEDNEGRC